MKGMKAVILLGGEGTRLRPLTYDVPKPMVPIVNKPYMEHQIEYLMSHGFTEIIFALGYKSEAFEAWFGDGSRWGGRFWHEVESVPLNTAGPVKNVEHLLDDTFLVFNGDILTDMDLTALVRLHREQGAAGTLALVPVEDPSAYGVVETDGEGRVRAFIEKPPPGTTECNAINAGVYVLEPRVLGYVPSGKPHSFERQLFPDLVKAGEPLYGVVTSGYWMDIGSVNRYLQAHHDVLQGRVAIHIPGASGVDGRQWIAESATVHPQATLEGPVWIGEGTTIGAGVHIVGPAAVGAQCQVGRDTRITHSVVWRDTVIGPDARLDGCAVGRGCTVGSGAVVEREAVLGSGQVLGDGVTLAAGVRLPE